jgi:hypothetical protein
VVISQWGEIDEDPFQVAAVANQGPPRVGDDGVDQA